MDAHQALSAKQRSIIPIAAFTANGDMEKLRTALHEGLDAGLTVNEIKEILVQMYAYAGFPRSLNGINTFMPVMDERQTKGIKDEMGKEASPVPADMNKDAYGARVRARLTGRDVIPPPSGYPPDRDRWRWPDTGMGRPDRGDPDGRRDLVPATGKTLARSLTHHRHDAYRHYGNNQREKRGMDGKGHRRAIPRQIRSEAWIKKPPCFWQ